MNHLSEDRLVDLALGDVPTPDEQDHLQSCRHCTSSYAELQSTASAVRRAAPQALVTPPARVWDAIRAELEAASDRGLDGDSTTRGDAYDLGGRPDAHSDQRAAGRTGGVAGRDLADDQPPASVTRLDERRRGLPPSTTWLLAAACILGIILGVGGSTLVGRLSERPQPGETTVAQAPLSPLDAEETTGFATLVARDGGLRLDVPELGLDPGDGFLEVWLINRDLTRMISIGVIPVDATEVVLPVPQRLIDEGYVIVDISREPFDDQPAHSGETLVRGELST